jgi:limonene-1,2-epoxide hydrolase
MSIEQIVRAEMAAWGHNDVDEIISHFADDATFDIGPAWPKVAGREAIYDLLKNFFAGGTCIELEILHLAMDGDVVLMERTDHWSIGGQKTSWPVMGAYEVHGDKITAWREYYFPPSAPRESEG